MTLTRTPACTVKGCPQPKSPDFHIPICGHGLEGHHHHVVKRSQGGKDGPQVFICPKCHDNIDNGEWGNAIVPKEDGTLAYWVFDIHGKTLIEEVMPSDGRPPNPQLDQREVGRDGQALSAAAEGEQSMESVIGPSVAAPSAGLGGEAATPPQVSPSPSLTHEQRVAIAQDIKDTEWNRQWFAGDIGNLWIEQLGESAEQYLSDFGYQPESLANILRVCAKIPPAYRNGNLRFSHHVVVAGENLEDVEMHLAECEEEQWSVAEFRRQRKGTKPRVKRWSLEELRSSARECTVQEAEAVMGFLDYLEEQA